MLMPPAELERPAQAWQPTEMDDEELGLVVVYAFFLGGDWTIEPVTIRILLLVLRPQALGCGPYTDHLIAPGRSRGPGCRYSPRGFPVPRAGAGGHHLCHPRLRPCGCGRVLAAQPGRVRAHPAPVGARRLLAGAGVLGRQIPVARRVPASFLGEPGVEVAEVLSFSRLICPTPIWDSGMSSAPALAVVPFHRRPRRCFAGFAFSTHFATDRS